MRFFLDTEFIESGPHKPIQLISIGIVAADGREFYRISEEFNPLDASDWVKENVLLKLEPPEQVPRTPLRQIGLDIVDFIHLPFPYTTEPEFWGYFADYDWVVFCQIFGTMMDLPKGYPMYCRDIKQLCDEKGNPKLPEQGNGEHNALADARWNKEAWEFLNPVPRCVTCGSTDRKVRLPVDEEMGPQQKPCYSQWHHNSPEYDPADKLAVNRRKRERGKSR